MPGVIVDGNSIADVNEAIMIAAERARNGQGPSLIECKTYRTRGHSRSDRNRYRTKEEIEDWKLRDPIPAFEAELQSFGVLSAAEVEAVRAQVEVEVNDGFNFAQAGTNPVPESVLRDVYTTGGAA
jgi:pyruvate dehydrogenase E1 component alpha subunit